MACLVYTKISLNISLKGFPVGEIMNCHFWTKGNLSMDDARKQLNDVDFNQVFDGKRFYHDHTITSLTNTIILPKNDNLTDLIVDSISKKPVTPLNINDIDLSSMNDDDILLYKKAFITESFKRRYNMSDDEYDFYRSYSDKSISIDAIINIYRSTNGIKPINTTGNKNISTPLSDLLLEKKKIIREKLNA